jgi:hypothetical protein
MPFLPEDYKEPVMSNYMSFEEGDNTFRVLDESIIGWEYWTKDDRPVRVNEFDNIPLGDVKEGKYGLNLSFFWAFPVYNFDAGRVQILVVKQKTVRQGMLTYIKNKKWGDPKSYNFVVTRIKEGDKTSYLVSVDPKEELDKKIVEKYKEMNLDMKTWFKGEDPFKGIKQDEVEPKEETLSDKEVDEVNDKIPF